MTDWTVTVTPNAGRPTFRIVAVSPDRRRVIHYDRQTAADVERFHAVRAWRHGLMLAGIQRPKADDLTTRKEPEPDGELPRRLGLPTLDPADPTHNPQHPQRNPMPQGTILRTS